MKYRIVQQDYRNDDTGYPVKRYYIEYWSKSFCIRTPRWMTYKYIWCGINGNMHSETPKFDSIKKAKKYIDGLKKPLINKVVK